MSKYERFTRRLDIFIEAIHSELRADEADDFLEEKLTELGPKSEQRAVEIILDFPFVKSVSKTSKIEDERGKDLWVRYTRDSGHADTSIQVKSSGAGVRKFIRKARSEYGRDYLKDSRQIVLNTGPQVSNRSIRRSFIAQLRKLDGYIQRREN